MEQRIRNLPLTGLDERHRGLAGGVGAAYYAATRVCLDRHHTPPSEFQLEDTAVPERVGVDWNRADEATRGAWANETDATEAAGYAIVIAAVELARGFLAVRRAEGGTGADYYVGPPGSGVEDLEDCIRLEVSATDRSNEPQIRRLLDRKIAQTRAGRSNLPAMAGVVGLEHKLVLLGPVEEAA